MGTILGLLLGTGILMFPYTLVPQKMVGSVYNMSKQLLEIRIFQ